MRDVFWDGFADEVEKVGSKNITKQLARLAGKGGESKAQRYAAAKAKAKAEGARSAQLSAQAKKGSGDREMDFMTESASQWAKDSGRVAADKARKALGA